MPDKLEVVARKAIDSVQPPATTQDKHDQRASELHVAGLLRSLCEARYNAAKNAFIEDFSDTVQQVRGSASEMMLKTVDNLEGPDWISTLSAARPVISVPHDAFVIELIKLGVKREHIDKAAQKATKKATPALTISCVEKGK